MQISNPLRKQPRKAAVSIAENVRLKALLDKQVQAVSEAAIEAQGQIDGERLKALENLARLVEMREKSMRFAAWKRWVVVGLLFLALVVISALLFTRVPITEVELDLALSEVSFTLPARQPLSDGMALDYLGVDGLEEIQLPRLRGQPAQTFTSSEGGTLAIKLSPDSNGERQGTVDLAALPLPAGSRVWLKLVEGSLHQYRLSVQAESLLLQANVSGPVQILLSGGDVEQPSTLDFDFPKPLLLQPVEPELTFSPAERSRDVFSTQLAVSNLSFMRIDKDVFANSERATRAQLKSSILSGRLFLESLNGQEVPLRSGERLRFRESDGYIRTLELRDDHIALQFQGRVRGMSTGSEENERSLMPTNLEWLQARRSLALLWGTSLSLFLLFAGVFRWWRSPA